MGLRKALKKITKGLRKAAKSKLGKVLLAGAALWAGGQILGRLWASAGSAGGTAGVGAEAGSTVAKTALESTASSSSLPIHELASHGAAKEGIISKAIKGVGGFIEKNPMASSMMFNAVASATAPDEMELLEEQEKIRRQKYRNMEVPDSIGISPRGIISGGMR